MEAHFGNCLAVSQPTACMLRDGLVLGPDRGAQPHTPALGRVSATAAQAVSRWVTWCAFGETESLTAREGSHSLASWSQECEGGVGAPVTGREKVWAWPAAVLQAECHPPGLICQRGDEICKVPFSPGHSLRCLFFLLEWLVIKFCPLFQYSHKRQFHGGTLILPKCGGKTPCSPLLFLQRD